MLRLPSFRLLHPHSLSEAAQMLADEGPGARIVAGGTDLWPNMKRRHQTAEVVISLQRVRELVGIDYGDDAAAEVRIGALTPLAGVVSDATITARFPALARAVASVASPPIRNQATIGGNVLIDTRCTYYNQSEEWRRSIDYCMKEAGTVCWVAPKSKRCWAHSASDGAPMLCALEARAVFHSVDGERTVPLTDLYREDGIDYLTKQPHEILTRLLIPAASDSSACRSAFWKLRRRGSIDFAVLSVAAAVWQNAPGEVEKAHLFLGAVASSPLAVPEAAEYLVLGGLSEESLAAAAKLARAAATPMDNTDFRTSWRGAMVEQYTGAALGEIAGLPPERLNPGQP